MGEKEQMMFYKYWKVFLLALTSFFWAGCDDSSSEAECLYGPPPEYQSSNSDKVESSATVGDDEISSGSNETVSSNSVEPFSTSSNGRAPVNCYTTSVKDTAGSSYSIYQPLHPLQVGRLQGDPQVPRCNLRNRSEEPEARVQGCRRDDRRWQED